MTKANGKPRINSRAKGGRIERMAVAMLKGLGFVNTRRTAQHSGKTGHAADIVCDDLPHIHFEVKGVRGLDIGTQKLTDAIEQASRDCAGKKTLTVLWYAGRGKWRITLYVNPYGLVTMEPTARKLQVINDASMGA